MMNEKKEILKLLRGYHKELTDLINDAQAIDSLDVWLIVEDAQALASNLKRETENFAVEMYDR